MFMRISGVEVSVVRSDRKTISIEVVPSGVIVRTPRNAPDDFIRKVIVKHRKWITKKVEDFRKRRRYFQIRGFRDGVPFFFLGNAYPLKIVSSPVPLELKDGFFFLSSKSLNDPKRVFVDWYKSSGFTRLYRRVELFSGGKIHSKNVKITRAEKRWGSCSGKNTLCFSYRVLMLPGKIIDYIVVHEVAHIREKNHSQRFWNLVESLMPDFAERDRWLKLHGWAFVL